tara:strand:+ start:81 stop:641 length:561 start_codon:yes stop_codon:yes gene_type:complete
MEKFIKVYDNLIPIEIQNLIESNSLVKLPWYYTNNFEEFEPDKSAPALSHFFLNSGTDVTNTLDSTPYPYSFFYSNILYRLAHKENLHIDTIYTGRLFMNLPTPNPTPDSIHIDLPYPHWVCLYYVTDSDGDTVLFEDDRKTEIKRITPKKGRIVFFDGSIPHHSSKPAKNTRVIVNFDFKGYKFR